MIMQKIITKIINKFKCICNLGLPLTCSSQNKYSANKYSLYFPCRVLSAKPVQDTRRDFRHTMVQNHLNDCNTPPMFVKDISYSLIRKTGNKKGKKKGYIS